MLGIARVEDAFPTFSRYTGAVATVPTAGTLAESNMTSLDLGTISVSGGNANGDAKGLALQYAADFNDSVYANTTYKAQPRLWCANKPLKSFITLAAEFANGATFPAVALTAALAGATAAELSGDPLASVIHLGASNVYDSTNNRIDEILIQAQCLQAGAVAYSTVNRPHGSPFLVLEIPRADPAVFDYDPADITMDLDRGHGMVFTDCQIYMKDPTFGDYQLIVGSDNINSIREDTITLEFTEERVKWEKSKPKVVYHEARSALVGSIKLMIAQENIAWDALSHQTTAARNNTTGTFDFQIAGQTSAVKDREWLVTYRDQGGFMHRYYVPRGSLTKTGAKNPGAGEFAETEFTITPKAFGSNRSIVTRQITVVPTEVSILPMKLAVTV